MKFGERREAFASPFCLAKCTVSGGLGGAPPSWLEPRSLLVHRTKLESSEALSRLRFLFFMRFILSSVIAPLCTHCLESQRYFFCTAIAHFLAINDAHQHHATTLDVRICNSAPEGTKIELEDFNS